MSIIASVTVPAASSTGSRASRLVDLTDINATDSAVGKVLAELPPVAGVRKFGFVEKNTDFTVNDWDMRPLSNLEYTTTAGADFIDGALRVTDRLALPVNESDGGSYISAHTALSVPVNIDLGVPVNTPNFFLMGIHRQSTSVIDQINALNSNAMPLDTFIYLGGSALGGYQLFIMSDGVTEILNDVVVNDLVRLSVSADYVLTVGGHAYQLSAANAAAFSVASYALGRDNVGDMYVSALSAADAVLPVGAVDGDVYRVTHGGQYGGKQTIDGDFVQLIENQSSVIITRVNTVDVPPPVDVAGAIEQALSTGGAIAAAIKSASDSSADSVAVDISDSVAASKHDIYSGCGIAYLPYASAPFCQKDGLYLVNFADIEIDGVIYAKNSFFTKVGNSYQQSYGNGDTVLIKRQSDGTLDGRYNFYNNTEWLPDYIQVCIDQNNASYGIGPHVRLEKQFKHYVINWGVDIQKIMFGNGGYGDNLDRKVLIIAGYSGSVDVFVEGIVAQHGLYVSGDGITKNGTTATINFSIGDRVEVTYNQPIFSNAMQNVEHYISVKLFSGGASVVIES